MGRARVSRLELGYLLRPLCVRDVAGGCDLQHIKTTLEGSERMLILVCGSGCTSILSSSRTGGGSATTWFSSCRGVHLQRLSSLAAQTSYALNFEVVSLASPMLALCIYIVTDSSGICSYRGDLDLASPASI